MPDSTIPRTPNGWPLLDQDNFIRATPEYTRQLAEKLDNGEADVAAAINAARQAQAAAAAVPRVASGVFVEPTDERPTSSYIRFPAGRFTQPPVVVVTHADAAGATTWDAPRLSGTTTSGFTLFHKNGAGARFNWIAIQNGS